MSGRRGTSLAELLVALALAGIIGASAMGGLIPWGRSISARMRAGEGARVGREVLFVVQAIGRQLRHPKVVGDTALMAEYRVSAGVLCASSPTSITLAPAHVGELDALTFVQEEPMMGDLLEVYQRPDSGGQGWEGARVLAVRVVSAKEGCGAESPFISEAHHAAPALRLDHTGITSELRVGRPVEVFREVRLVTYNAGLHGWTIGWRHCHRGHCLAAQPIVGPVRSPAEDGVRFDRPSAGGPMRLRVRPPGSVEEFHGTMVPDDALP